MRLAVIGMGKCGGRELNYVSDVDVIFVAEPVEGADEAAALRTATTLAATLMRLCCAQTAEGTIWEVDAGAAAGGHAPARWCARCAATSATTSAGPRPGSSRRCSRPAPWPATSSSARSTSTPCSRSSGGRRPAGLRRRTSRRCAGGSSDNMPAKDADRQLKLGPRRAARRRVRGAAAPARARSQRRDAAQPDHARRRSRRWRPGATSAVTTPSSLASAYRFLRTLEHRIQLHRLRRTHVVPREDERPAPARPLAGLHASDPVGSSSTQWQRHAREVRRLHEKLFYRPLLRRGRPARRGRGAADPARPPASGSRRSATATRPGALRHLEALTSGRDPARGDPAHAAAGDARLVRRRARPGRRPARLPAGQRRARLDALVPAAAARRGRVPPSGWPGCSASQPVRRRPARCAPRRRAVARRRRRSCGPGSPRGADDRDRWPPPRRYDDAGGGRRGPRAAPPGAVPHRGRRRPRADRRSTTSAAPSPTSPTPRSPGPQAATTRRSRRRRGGPLPTRFAVIGDGALRRRASSATAATPTCCSCTTRCPGRRRARGRRRCDAGGQRAAHGCSRSRRRTRRWSSTPTCAPRAGRARWCARSPPTRAYYARWSVRRGRPRRCCAPTPVAGDPELWARVRRADRPAALARRRCRPPTSCARSGGSRPAWRPSGCPAAPTRRCTRSSGRGGLSDVEWIVQLLQLQHAPPRPGAAHHPHAARAGGRAPDRAARAGRRRRPGRGLADRHPGPQRGHAGARPGHRPGAHRRARARRGRPDPRVRAGRVRALLEDYRRMTRRARAAAERLFYGQ